MTRRTPINLVTEDLLSEAIAQRVIAECTSHLLVAYSYGKAGNGYIRKQLPSFNLAAQFCRYFVITDLDARACASEYAEELLSRANRHANLVLRVAVREVEAWILGDRTNLAKFLSVRENLIPANPEALSDPKEALLRVMVNCRSSKMREALVRRNDSSVSIGPDYNGTMAAFVLNTWDVHRASANCSSLNRAINALTAIDL